MCENQYCHALTNVFLDFLNSNGFVQSVDSPTRNHSILDIFCTNRPSLVTCCQILPGISDHEAVLVKTLTVLEHPKPTKRKIYLWNRVDFVLFRNVIQSKVNGLLSDLSLATDIDTLWLILKNLIHSTIDELVPFRLTSSSLHQPWITNSLKRLCRIKQRKYNIARYYNTQKHWEGFKAFKKQVQSKCKQAHLQYVCRICDDNKKFWKYIKHKRMDHCGIASLKHGTEVVCEGHEKANILNEYFSGVFTREDDNVPTSLPAFYPCVCDPVITLDGVVKLLQDFKI